MITIRDGKILDVLHIEERSKSNGSYQGAFYQFSAAADTMTEKEWTWPYAIDALAGYYWNDDCQAGDTICFQVRPGQVGVVR